MTLVLALTAWGLFGTAPANAADPLGEIPFAVAVDRLFDEARNDHRSGQRGRWELLEGRLNADTLRLKFRIKTPPYELPVEPGPSVLFGGLRVFGDAGGDMGAGESVDSFKAVTLDQCSDLQCVMTATIELPTSDIQPAIRRLEKVARVMWVSAEFTLVRTFGQGEWLQVLPFQYNGDGVLGAIAGSLKSIEPTEGMMYAYGLFPAGQATRVGREPHLLPRGFDYAASVEKRRRAAGDRSNPTALTTGTLSVAIQPPCEGSPALTLHDDGGDWIFESKLHRVAEIDEPLMVPADVQWWLTLHDGGGIDFDPGNGFGVRLGPVAANGTPVAIDATLDCSVPSGVIRQDGVVVGGAETPSPSRSAPAVVQTAAPAAASATPVSSQQSTVRALTSSPAMLFLAVASVALAGVWFGVARRRRRD